MDDKERLDLIEHYQWDVLCYSNKLKPWRVFGKFGRTGFHSSLREAIHAALAAQVKWALNR